MDNQPAILKDPKLRHDEDYQFLRDSGRRYIEELGSAIWTDYNEHDPGITILEALCYAITELGYRTSFPMKDLLTEKDGTISSSQTFFTARNILTQSPLNKDDYRKLLIDIEGVQNAWLFSHSHYKDDQGKVFPAGEVPVFADIEKDELTYQITSDPVYFRGLYKVLLDLEDDPQLGDLNNGEIDVNIGTANLILLFQPWNEILKNDPALFSIDPGAIPAIVFPPAFDATTAVLTITFIFNGNAHTLSGKVSVGLQPASGPLSNANIGALFTTGPTLAQQVLNLYLSKIIKARRIVEAAARKLNWHRNLCEDFVSIETIIDEEIAFCFDVDVIPSADIEEVEANILFTIEEYLDPPVKFYLLQEMLQKINPDTGNLYTVDEVFEGPKLKHGFIDTTELENAELRTEIYASEIISRIMNIQIDNVNVILAVRDFKMTAYGDDHQIIPGEDNQRWCIKVNTWRKPILAKDKSKIVLYKNEIPFLAREKETDETLEWLESLQAREKLISTSDDIPLPEGSYFPLETFTSVQQLFPKTYSIGSAALPSVATDERRAQSKQLKAYLLFYDQLLADFFMQLKNAKELFSTDPIKQTYYAQFVSGFLDFKSIYKKDSTNHFLLENNVLLLQDSTTGPIANEWEILYESNKTFLDRRNRFLDHLMSRFAESFNEYVFLMYSLDNTTQTETRIDPADLIKTKIEFLVNYPRLSYNRAKGFNYCPLDNSYKVISSKLWNTDNVSGLEEKLCMLGGFADPSTIIKNYYRRFLRCIGSGNITLAIQAILSGTTSYHFLVTLGPLTLTSVNYPTLTALNTDLIQLLTNSGTVFTSVPDTTGTAFISQATINGNLIQSNSFGSQNDADQAISNFMNDITKGTCSNEGLYLIEHILLRPRTKNYLLAPVCLEPDCISCNEDDPYSFRISIVLPYWVSHFNNMDFRTYFEKMARDEAPAHCMVKVCWINEDAMLLFEICYYTWIQAMAAYYSDRSLLNETFLTDANNNLINALYSLHSEYPVATLHDCDESKDTNPVMLGKTVLGTIK
jgi:hypothetical protein